MLSKLKTLYRIIIGAFKIIVVSTIIFVVFGFGFYASYTAGQMDACNAMLRNDPQTKNYGLYCEQMIDGIVVRSTVLKKSLFNITLDKTYFIIGN